MKKSLIIICASILLLLCQSGCNTEGHKGIFAGLFSTEKDNTNVMLSSEKYIQWVEDEENQMTRSKTIDDLEFELQYKPVDYIISMEESDSVLTDSLINERRKELEGMYYFDFKIALKDGSGELLKHELGSAEEYEARVEYFAFKMQNDLSLTIDNEKIPCSLFHFERAYDVAPYSIFLLGFIKGQTTYDENTEVKFEYHDQIFQKGIIKFIYTIHELNNTPKIQAL
jgi:hypothetical protein